MFKPKENTNYFLDNGKLKERKETPEQEKTRQKEVARLEKELIKSIQNR